MAGFARSDRQPSSLPLGCPLGCLEGVDSNFCNLDLRLLVGGEITDSQAPLGFRIHIGGTALDAVLLDDAFASFTFVNDGLESIFDCCFCHIGLPMNAI